MYNLPLKTMYVDLNSCFATIEQQARPMLRGRPVAITNRLTPNACIVAASYEAKALGVKVGMRRMEAESITKDIIFAETEPDKYIFVHKKLRKIMEEYSPDVTMKSIDEGVLNLALSPENIQNKPNPELVAEIKSRLRNEVGSYMSCNIGISSNRFLAKLAAELHKPDGYDEITPANQREIFGKLKLQDLPGINVRMEARLNAVGIRTPLQFLDADEETLVKMVCKSIDGHKWYQRLRGLEVDDWVSDIKSIGRQYVLESNRLTHQEIEARVIHLAEDAGMRLRSRNLYARGIYVWAVTYDDLPIHKNILLKDPIHTDADIIRVARKLFEEFPAPLRIVGVTLYKIQDSPQAQLSLDQDKVEHNNRLCQATDTINRRFGDRTIFCADSFGTELVKVKIPFGSTRFL
jgi:DNA polymerase-4